jgi:hypothetical protein
VLAEIIALVMAVPGVYNCAVTAPIADVVAASDEKIIAGIVAIT